MTYPNAPLDKSFDPHAIEKIWRQAWEKQGYAQPAFARGAPDFSMQLPPPNVTGTLHIGHAFEQTLMDSLARYHRMCGANTLWIPGTDHAGIATQLMVERQLEAQQQTRGALGRERFIRRVWAWKKASGSTITQQMRRLGVSIDWSREYFTMDAQRSQAVTEAFARLYQQGLIYRGKRLVNWDPKLGTAVSDLEVVNQEEAGTLWNIRYPFAEGSRAALVVATTRPETLLGDAAVMVHPEDERYQAWIGKKVQLPLCGRQIPVIADAYVDRAFGTGVVKVTPAHDFNDYQIGQRHALPCIEILTLDAKINDNAPGRYRGLDCAAARKAVIADLTAQGLLESAQPHTLSVPRGERSGAVIEPMLTQQWFVAVNTPAPEGTHHPGRTMAEVASDAVRSGEIQFVPENWARTYHQWLDNLQDWCISRQLWWGHQIPAWYDDTGRMYVARSEDEASAQARANGYSGALTRDEDVLDTWFSSALVPFSSLGWPSESLELARFLPSSVLVTGFDIIFFWVARMAMMSLHLTGRAPFKTVYVHGLVRDAYGRKMSKSKGNTLDPIDLIDGIARDALIEKRTQGLLNPKQAEAIAEETRNAFPNGIPAFGADALRFTCASLATPGRNINFDLARCEGYRNFCNKLWNATRFVCMHCSGECRSEAVHDIQNAQSYADRWILSALQRVNAAVEKHFADFRFDLIAQAIYQFIWNEYCDWYIEFAKVQLQTGPSAQQRAARHTLLHTLETALRLAHPLMPFITEALWQSVAPLAGDVAEDSKHLSLSIMAQPYPHAQPEKIDPDAEQWVAQLKIAIDACRTLRGEMKLAPSRRVPLFASGDGALLASFSPYMRALARLSDVVFCADESALDQAASGAPVALAGALKIALKTGIDPAAGRARLDKEIRRIETELSRCRAKLSHEAFVAKAPEAVVAQERKRLSEHEAVLDALIAQRARI